MVDRHQQHEIPQFSVHDRVRTLERANGFLETSFVPGRSFASPADFNTQLADWLARANQRSVRSIGGRPVELLEADQAAMTPLSPIDPPTGLGSRVRLARDHYVRVDTCDYSVDPRADELATAHPPRPAHPPLP